MPEGVGPRSALYPAGAVRPQRDGTATSSMATPALTGGRALGPFAFSESGVATPINAVDEPHIISSETLRRRFGFTRSTVFEARQHYRACLSRTRTRIAPPSWPHDRFGAVRAESPAGTALSQPLRSCARATKNDHRQIGHSMLLPGEPRPCSAACWRGHLPDQDHTWCLRDERAHALALATP